MNTEPPVGDDLQRMLVSMKQTVLERATPRPRRRGRRTGIAIGVVGVLLLGAAGGGVALGLIPTSVTAGPAPVTTPSAEPSRTETPSGAPVVGRPTPTAVPTPTPTSTRPPYSATDPSTWTISGSEVGPIALGGPVAGELDDLDPAYSREVENACPNPDVTSWSRPGTTGLTVIASDGVVGAVALGNDVPSDAGGPTTVEGIGLGSTMTELREAYPDLTFVPSQYGPTPESDFPQWTIARDGHHVTFLVDAASQRVGLIWVSAQAEAPGEFCG